MCGKWIGGPEPTGNGPPPRGGNEDAIPCNADHVTETEMMQRVVAILTQAKEMSDAWEEDIDREDLSEQQELTGELIADALRLDGLIVTDPSPQAVADAVMQAIQPRVGSLVAHFIAAFMRLAHHHDTGDVDVSSVDVLRRLALEWELDDEPS